MQKGPKYTVILHDVRRNLQLSSNEYIIIEGISHLSNQEKYPWCLTTREDLAEFYGFSKKGIIKLIDRLVERGLIEKNEDGNLRASELWINATTDPVNLVHQYGELSTPNTVNLVHQRKNDVTQVVGVLSTPNHNHNNNHNNNQQELEKNVTDISLRGKKIEDIAEELKNHFFNCFNRTGGGIKTTVKNLSYWLDEYSVDDIKQAITNASQDNFWKNTLTLELLLRKRKASSVGEEHEYVDRIGRLLALSTNQNKNYEKISYGDVWNIAKEKSIGVNIVKEKAKRINDMIDSGEFAKRNVDKAPKEALLYWIDVDISKGFIKNANEMELMEIEYLSPENISKRRAVDEIKRQMRAKQ